MKTIEDANQMQRLVEHLASIRKSRAYLAAHKNARASRICLTSELPEGVLPLKYSLDDFTYKGRKFTRERGTNKWTEDLRVSDRNGLHLGNYPGLFNAVD
jgi:hypothetical protein